MKKKRKHYLTTGEVAQVFEVSGTAVKKWIQQGKLRALRTPGGHFRIATQDFQRFRKAHGF
ncbi:MAG: excisionase family DNA-binding protein [Candidatus Rokuibacteriota bacterium]